MTNVATVPAWLTTELHQGRDWEVRGERRYRCRWPNIITRELTDACLVVTNPDETGYLVWLIDAEHLHRAAFDLEDHTFQRLEAEMARRMLPTCVVPGCDEKGPLVFTAAEYGRLAGRAWEPGDEVRLCPAHGNDVWRAQGVYGLDDLPEWLRADAVLEPMDAYDAATDSIYGSEIDRSRRRMLRLVAERA